MKADRYYLYNEIVSFLNSLVASYPGMCSLESIGKTFEGRDILCLTVCTDGAEHAGKRPAFYMDGNIHANEVASSMAVLYTLDRWLSAYGSDPEITSLLDRYTVYAVPRINADAAEVFLTTPGDLRGSTEKYYPGENGIQPCDLDGDGMVRQMRIPDPAGKWKASERDPRIMVPRGPDDITGQFYTLVSEGMLTGTPEDLADPKDARPREDLDPNRQFPFEWNRDYPDPARPTSGPEPLHDRETRALYDFVCARPNIVFHMNFHTYGGLHISPAAFCPHLDAPDAEEMLKLGLAMREKTGYKCEGIFPEGARDIAPGCYTAWEYFEKGIMAFVTELWDFHFQADPDRPEGWSMFFAESGEQFMREAETAIRWDEENNHGAGFKAWTPFSHPQPIGPDGSGQVEIGGWCGKFCRQNPPAHLLEKVCEKGCLAALTCLKAMPRLSILSVRAGFSGGQTVITTVIADLGFLPSTGTKLAAEKKLTGPVTVTLEGCRTLGSACIELERIDGYSKKAVSFPVELPAGADITVTVRGERCGEIKRTVHCSPCK